ncbi:MAG: hypothetical protein KF768_05375 [Phycisphaeraceae bacterium]|nr:hypothetical protein [Phycisphaeraceae bacterium]
MNLARNTARTPARTLARLGLAAAAALSFTFLSGCYAEGGRGASEDLFTYISHEFQPWTVTLVDTRTREVIWSIDIPVGQQLVVGFSKGEGTDDTFTPDRMRWALMPAGSDTGSLPNELPVPPRQARRLDPYLRAVPELPPDMAPGRGRAPITEIGDARGW